ncbi:uncharacterized protein LOC130967901 [Arachis stenosperma]|uniref:uncharacterized protein LOC130967901 n=1 Tax=Arachis stenosperma TaxID=217475 RepID=UPI0025ACCE86|nr:uncharacterized protein LOC130967901 [Arachis stenosperma]
MTKKERRAKKVPLQFVESSQANTQQQTGQNKSTANAEETTLDAAAKAKKNKKKKPKTSATGQSVNCGQGEEINVSQSAPQADEPATAPCFREKQPIVRPTAPTNQGVSTGVSAETMAAATSGTASRLFKFIPTPGIRPPDKN